MFIEHLPPHSATAQAMEPRLAWTVGDYLMAALIDRVSELEWFYAQAHSKKGSRPPRPKPVPRPGDDNVPSPVVDAEPAQPYRRPRPVPRINTPEELAAFLKGR